MERGHEVSARKLTLDRSGVDGGMRTWVDESSGSGLYVCDDVGDLVRGKPCCSLGCNENGKNWKKCIHGNKNGPEM